ncbi:MAG: hypothetical protein JOZ38_03890 [Candidatus Eremiobacteraeota bacterium]|nr:hypothetical protein [Candidatus Eremiobacteraeota bacterium]
MQGAYYIATGIAPFLSRRLFERVTGPKSEWWLVQMVGLLAVTNGLVLVAPTRGKGARRAASRLAVLSALSFCIIDVYYASRKRISPIYLADAALEASFIAAAAMAKRFA